MGQAMFSIMATKGWCGFTMTSRTLCTIPSLAFIPPTYSALAWLLFSHLCFSSERKASLTQGMCWRAVEDSVLDAGVLCIILQTKIKCFCAYKVLPRIFSCICQFKMLLTEVTMERKMFISTSFMGWANTTILQWYSLLWCAEVMVLFFFWGALCKVMFQLFVLAAFNQSCRMSCALKLLSL